VTTGGCAQLDSTTQSQHSAFVASEGMWIASGVLAVGAIATWFLWPKASVGSQSTMTVVPTVGGGSAGAMAVGTF
jgi:hypothetical protein